MVAAAIAVVTVLAASDPGSDRQRAERHDVEVVQQAASRMEYRTVNDAWMLAHLGASAALSAIVEEIDVRYRSAYQDGDAIVRTFESRSGACIHLVSRPGPSSVESRDR